MDSKRRPIHGGISRNPNSTSKPAMAFHFLRALSHIRLTTRRGSSLARRTLRIRRAAYASMACSAGTRRAWSRALLRKLRSPAPRRGASVLPRRAARTTSSPDTDLRQALALRRLVPGGAAMEHCELLEETADYIRCLNAQVWLMQAVVHGLGDLSN
ncbi:hypothetical protein Cni_G12417 [Canna indica]|uniref:IBH1-like N-terminal domain-containing protein n=1 Tax=Canna indica TaxID=4628 RepID=A0AAQ3K7S3_9LILI|nr:hypothetical protein Cni_G12417 [Canna indica]